MPRASSAYQTVAYQIVFGLAVFGLGTFLVHSAMNGSYGTVRIVVFGLLAVAVALLLDKNYLLLCPLFSIYHVAVPGLPFSLNELGALSFLTLFFVRLSMKREKLAPAHPYTWFAWPYFVWALMTYFRNPVGLAMFGASGIGARYYFDICLGFFVLLAFSRVRFSDKQCNTLFWWMVAVSALTVVRNYFMQDADADDAWTYEDSNHSTRYWLDPVVFVALLLMCRYCVADILKSVRRFFFVSATIALIVYSGRRTYTGYAFLAPFFLAVMRGREKFLTLVCALAAMTVVMFIAVGNGRAYELPLSVQRALSPLPGKWDRSLDNYGTKDLFREEMKRLAKEEIAKDPLFGRGGLQLSFEEVAWAHRSDSRGSTGEGMAQVGNWHNKFWGMSADFGLPAGFFLYIFACAAGWYAFKNRFSMRGGGARSALALYYSLLLFYDLVFTMGGSAMTPSTRWPQFAFLLALLNPPAEDDPSGSGLAASGRPGGTA